VCRSAVQGFPSGSSGLTLSSYWHALSSVYTFLLKLSRVAHSYTRQSGSGDGSRPLWGWGFSPEVGVGVPIGHGRPQRSTGRWSPQAAHEGESAPGLGVAGRARWWSTKPQGISSRGVICGGGGHRISTPGLLRAVRAGSGRRRPGRDNVLPASCWTGWVGWWCASETPMRMHLSGSCDQ
jgi:hypothetical protein